MPLRPAKMFPRDERRRPFSPPERLTLRFEKLRAKPRPRLLRLRKTRPTGANQAPPGGAVKGPLGPNAGCLERPRGKKSPMTRYTVLLWIGKGQASLAQTFRSADDAWTRSWTVALWVRVRALSCFGYAAFVPEER
jgi:hypothetical protein